MRYIFDLDGTLADFNHRLHFLEETPKDWYSFFQACDQDRPIFPMVQTLLLLADGKNQVEIWTARCESVQEKTLVWLKDTATIDVCPANLYQPSYHKVQRLRMRPIGDYSQDTELKRKWVRDDFVEGSDRIDLVFEDRPRVVKMWCDLGIPCCQICCGNFT